MSADRTITLAEVAACDGISRRFDVPQRHGVSSTVLALDDVSLSIAAGRLVALNGPSGSGKSTLLAMLAALDHPTSGTVTVQGTDVGALGRADRRPQRLHDGGCARRVERTGGLVGQHERGRAHQRTGNGQSLLLTAAHRAARVVDEPAHAHACHQLVDGMVGVGGAHPA